MSAETFTQKERRIGVQTPLGKDVLLLVSFSGQEEMSRLFSYDLEMRSLKSNLAAKDIVGKKVNFWVEYEDGTQRHFHGHVRRFSYLGSDDRLSHYHAEVVPWLWFLTQTRDCRIFQNKSVVEIIEQIFNDLGFADFETSDVKSTHVKRDYCVQYRETDFDFVSRLMEEEGIFYYFRHEESKHTLVLADTKNTYKDCVDKEVRFSSSLSEPDPTDNITSWEHRYEYRSGKWAQTDYNFETPSSNLMAKVDSILKLDSIGKYEVYDYPGEYAKKNEGDDLVKLRMEEVEAGYDLVHGASYCRSFSPGGKFKVAKHFAPSEEGLGYVITAVRHIASVGETYVSGGSPEGKYANTFTCIPDNVVFRPARITPKPQIHGVQTALVVGPSGEEIYTDKYGRVKVQFYWDREGKKDDKSSCWIRVSHSWAGSNWGAVWHPRIGQEVIVSFLEGDPDRPIITGRVYNADQMPPYALPTNQTQSGFKSRSSKGGGGANFNEIRFEDKKGSEQVYIHAEKNQDGIVENDETHNVGHDRKKDIGNDETTTVGRDRTETVTRHETITIGENRTEDVGKNESISIGENRTETVAKNESITIGENRKEQVGKNEDLAIGENRQHNIGKNDVLTVANALSIDACDSILIKTGDASISMQKDGTIQIKGKDITISGSGKINVKASSDVTIKGSNVKSN